MNPPEFRHVDLERLLRVQEMVLTDILTEDSYYDALSEDEALSDELAIEEMELCEIVELINEKGYIIHG